MTHPTDTPTTDPRIERAERLKVMLREFIAAGNEIVPVNGAAILTLCDDLIALAARPPVEGDGWRPIESAPKDGTHIWGFTEDEYQREVFWVEEEGDSPDQPGHEPGWLSQDGSTFPAAHYHGPIPPQDPPTHWRPLPAPPAQGRK